MYFYQFFQLYFSTLNYNVDHMKFKIDITCIRVIYTLYIKSLIKHRLLMI